MALTAQNKTDFDAVFTAITTARAGLSAADQDSVAVSKMLRAAQQLREGVLSSRNK